LAVALAASSQVDATATARAAVAMLANRALSRSISTIASAAAEDRHWEGS